ncbi:hypothetical protein [Gordonia amicalis]|uniref:hypothetical protein n=1 Tax=Gordonia amicalis TaxID=89053 RepID=UPI0015F42AC1|nr:hypothetical protein [Gordonia amicalis]MBA5846410.1 hypothetical protein [Gordonia amicalis]UKO93917.1 hypothetical protein IHQ52_11870 [Gordonia amicalis]
MRTLIRVTTIAASVAAPVLGLAVPAHAVITDQYDRVKTVFCSTERYGNEVEYDNGNRHYDQRVQLSERNNGLWCGSSSFTEYKEYGQYISASIQNDNANYVYCAIWINGGIAERDEDRSEYGAWAIC